MCRYMYGLCVKLVLVHPRSIFNRYLIKFRYSLCFMSYINQITHLYTNQRQIQSFVRITYNRLSFTIITRMNCVPNLVQLEKGSIVAVLVVVVTPAFRRQIKCSMYILGSKSRPQRLHKCHTITHCSNNKQVLNSKMDHCVKHYIVEHNHAKM